MLTLTSPVETRLHRLPAGAKLAVLAGGSTALFLTGSAPLLAGAVLGVAGLHLLGGRALLWYGIRMLRPLWPFALVIGLWHLWLGAVAEGIIVLLRLVAVIAAANLVTMTTRLSDMIAVLERLARPLAPILPPERLALALGLVIRFIPVLSGRLDLLAQAFRARSPKRPAWRLVAPAALAALDDAENVADALRARGGAG